MVVEVTRGPHIELFCCGQPIYLSKVRSECEIYLNCDHPNINRLRDLYETDSYIYLVADCCLGGELYDRLAARGQYGEHQSALAMRGMLLAVSYIHNTLGIVHRDLKLQNWLFPFEKARDDELKLIDFGFSRTLAGDGMANVAVGRVLAGRDHGQRGGRKLAG